MAAISCKSAGRRLLSRPLLVDSQACRGLLTARQPSLLEQCLHWSARVCCVFYPQDRLLLGKVAGDAILTMGADRPDLDYERAWRRELGACSSKYTGLFVQLG